MNTLERQLAERYPRWFGGRRAMIARPLLRGLAQWSRLQHVYGFLESHAHLTGFALIAAGLEFLNLRYSVDPADRARLPAAGRLLIVANHPSGALDALALLDLVGSVRTDVKIVANDLLSQIEGLRELLLPVRILGGKPGAQSLAAIDEALRQEQCVIVFPAGEVSRLGARGITDTRWRRGFLRFARDNDAPVLPVRIQARNSALFYGASALSKPVGTALLAREMFKRSGRRIALRVGSAMRIDHAAEPEAALAQVRRTLYSLGRKNEEHVPAAPQALVVPVDPQALRNAVRGLELLGQTSDGKHICVGRLRAGSAMLREIGRLREKTFRAVGEGTGNALDVDAYDGYYEHIVLWDEAAGKIAGAYRIARGAPMLAAHGIKGLYTA
ncbi:MAG: lysophospholipid acyltransferase family protein, partial [Pseudoxanthomonas sp.]